MEYKNGELLLYITQLNALSLTWKRVKQVQMQPQFGKYSTVYTHTHKSKYINKSVVINLRLQSRGSRLKDKSSFIRKCERITFSDIKFL